MVLQVSSITITEEMVMKIKRGRTLCWTMEFNKEFRHFPIYQSDFIIRHQSVYGKIAVARVEVEGKACLAMPYG